MNIESIKSRLLVKYPFFGSVVAKSYFISKPEVGTAGTDGKSIYYNPDFIDVITDEQQVFIFAHEICHIAFNHVLRSKGKDQEIWNIATDAVINAFLKNDGLPIIDGGVDIPDAINYDAEEMYKRLLKERREQNKLNNQPSDNSKKGDNCNTSSNSNSNFNNSHSSGFLNKSHSMWNKALDDKYQKENGEIKKIVELGEKKVFKQNKIIRKKQLEELRESLVSQSHGYGSSTNSELRTVKDIGMAKELVNWKRILKETIKYDVDWSYQNAEIENGVVIPYLEELPKPETEIVLDTSGSIDETLLRNFLRECKNILKNSKVKVGCFDTKFYGFTEIMDISDIDSLSFYGGGGTNFDVAVNAFSKRVENKIIFTDGYAPMPTKLVNAIWIVFGSNRINPVGGKVIYINREQLEKLYNYQIVNELSKKLNKK